MVKVSVCYSSKNGTDFASCSVDGLEFAVSVLDDAAGFRDQVRAAYDRCVDAVQVQLHGERSAPPPAPSSTPPPVSSGGGSSTSAPPKTGKQLAGWAKTQGCLDWFVSFGLAQNPPLPKLLSTWPDYWATYAYGQFLAQNETDHQAHERRNERARVDERRESAAHLANGRY